MGVTKIDLEDRYFCHKWNQLENLPIETRQFINPETEITMGQLTMWLEIIPEKTIKTNKFMQLLDKINL